VAVPVESAPVEAAKTAVAVGRAAMRAFWPGFSRSALASASANLKLSLFLLLGGLFAIVAIISLPVLLVVFTLTIGFSHGLPFSTPAQASVSGPPLAPGQLACPVPGAPVTQPFGPSDLLGEPAMFGFLHFHTGVDLGAPLGTPILAAEGGQVIQAAAQTNSLGMIVGYGNLTRILTNTGRIEYYGHQTQFAVVPGQIVQQDQVIGFVGSTGYSTGPHLHFEVRVNNTPIDPAPFMQPC
jgi:murein DD-endopeptidase MepM/ murein hydrolase activator NlpD